jgi:hypothetical protein
VTSVLRRNDLAPRRRGGDLQGRRQLGRAQIGEQLHHRDQQRLLGCARGAISLVISVVIGVVSSMGQLLSLM